MAEKYSAKRTDPSDAYQMRPLSSQPFGGTNGIECLRMLDSLFVKQIPSITEGKLSKEWQIFVKLMDSNFKVIFRIATEAKYDIFNDRKERIFQAFESK
jgi:hypothetical protein